MDSIFLSLLLKEKRKRKDSEVSNKLIIFLFSFFLSWKPIIEYIDNKFEEYLNAESRVVRSPFPDDRVHCCLYFIAPTGHWLVHFTNSMLVELCFDIS